MKRVDRGDFSHVNPYMDAPQGIGYGVTISAPHMVNLFNLAFVLLSDFFNKFEQLTEQCDLLLAFKQGYNNCPEKTLLCFLDMYLNSAPPT